MRCFVYLFPAEKVSKNYKIKEKHFVEYIEAAGVLPDTAVITFDKRLMELFEDAGNRPQVQLRFNPDGFTSEDGTKHPSCFKYNKLGVPVIRDQTIWEARMDVYIERLK